MADEITDTAPAEDTAPVEGGPSEPQEQAEPQPAEGQPEKPEGEPKPEAEKPAEAAKPDPKAEREARETAARAEVAKRRQEVEAERTKLKAEREALAKDAERLKELREIAELGKQGPKGALAAIRKLGLNAKLVAEALAADETPTDPVAAKALAEAEALKKKLEERDAAEAKAKQEAQEREQEKQIHDHFAALFKAEPDRYEFLADEGEAGIKDVRDAAFAYWQKHGKLPDAKAVADQVEKFHRDAYARKSKLKGAAALSKPPEAAKPATKPTEEKPTTLSNRMGTRPGGPPAKGEAGTRLVDSDDLNDQIERVLKESAARKAANAQ